MLFLHKRLDVQPRFGHILFLNVNLVGNLSHIRYLYPYQTDTGVLYIFIYNIIIPRGVSSNLTLRRNFTVEIRPGGLPPHENTGLSARKYQTRRAKDALSVKELRRGYFFLKKA